MNDTPRSPLLHSMAITNEEFASYQIITPSTWNFSPKDETGMVVPAEESLIGANADPVNPVEPGRITRSFDPCLSCATHCIDWEGKTLYSSIGQDLTGAFLRQHAPVSLSGYPVVGVLVD